MNKGSLQLVIAGILVALLAVASYFSLDFTMRIFVTIVALMVMLAVSIFKKQTLWREAVLDTIVILILMRVVMWLLN
jgi:hypothetical protein